MTGERIFLLRGDELVEMAERGYDTEALLQRHLERHPALLAGDQMVGHAITALGPDGGAGHIGGVVYTNTGRIVDLSAPGGSFDGAAEDLVPGAWSPLSPDLPGALFAFALGTSMAAPHVTGAAALLFEEFGHGDPEEIRSRLQRSADLTGSGPSHHPLFGRGRLQIPTALGFVGGPY